MELINHLVVLMMENRSFDHVLGALSLPGRSHINGISDPLETNPAPDGSAVPQWCMDGAPFTYNVPHLRRDAVEQYDGGGMDGFVKAYAMENPGDSHWNIPMGYYTAKTFPVLYALASKFTVCDAWFSSMLTRRGRIGNISTRVSETRMTTRRRCRPSRDLEQPGYIERSRQLQI